MSGKLAGKVAVITGGSSGIGLAAAKAFVAEGAHVFLMGRRASELAKAAADIGTNASVVRADVASLDDLDHAFTAITREKGVIDIVVANAGFIAAEGIDTATPEHFDRTFDVNVRGTFFTVQKALPLMTRGGSIVLVASALHRKGMPNHGTYAASKAAVRSFARTWAAELKDRGIRVNSLSPGTIETPIFEAQSSDPEAYAAAKAAIQQVIPLGRIGRADEMAKAILFLASDDSSYVTGADLIADGGITQV